MKKWIMCAFTVMLLSLTLSVTAFAAGGDSGIYGVKAADGSGVTLTPVTADGGNITSSSANLDGNDVDDFYNDAARVQVNLTGAQSGKEYLVIVTEGTADTAGTVTPDANNIVYIDQVTAGGTSVSFNVYPKALTSGKTYSVRISTNAGDAQTGKLTEKGSFQYYAAYTLGDVNEDHVIDGKDATRVLLHAAERITLTGGQLSAAKVNSDDVVDGKDATRILLYAAERITSFN